MVQAKCLHQFVLLFLNSLIMAQLKQSRLLTSWWCAQPRIMCWARARSSSSELVDTATARRRQRVEDSHFAQNDEAEEQPSVAMKWRDAVKMATMRGPLPPDSTPNVPHKWQPGTPLLRPTDYMAPVPAEGQTCHVR